MTRKKDETLPPLPEHRDPLQDRLALRKKVRFFYDIQRLRLQTALRSIPKHGGTVIELTTYDKALLGARANELEHFEKKALADVAEHLQSIPFYRDVLSDKVRFRGIGPTMAGVILSEFDIEREPNVSKMWAFAGLAPIAALRCKSCHAVVVGQEGQDDAYAHTTRKPKPTDKPEIKKACPLGRVISAAQTYESGKAMRPVAGEKLRYNAFLRAKLVGVLGPVMLKVGSPWRSFYDNFKHRWVSAGKGQSDLHRHNAAIRYMIKMLLATIWEEWRAAVGLPGRVPYAEQYLGVKHSAPSAPLVSLAAAQVPEANLEIDAEIALLAEAAS